MGTRYVSEEHFRVASELAGQPLASPLRRGLALFVDWVILTLPSIAVALGAALLSLRLADPQGLRALQTVWNARSASPAAIRAAQTDLAPLLVRLHAPGLPAAVAAAVEAGDGEQAGALLAGHDFDFSLAIGPHRDVVLQPGHIRIELEKLIPKSLRAIALFGVGALYFTLLTRGRRGATPGKRLLGIRVARLDGGRLSLIESLERFSGYFHIPGSLGLSLLDLWHNPNRQQPHDRVVHTVVLRAGRRSASARLRQRDA
ncbi:MAG: RDD family protein [Acidobacteriota bacterium]